MHSPADGPFDPIKQILLLYSFSGGVGGGELAMQHFFSLVLLSLGENRPGEEAGVLAYLNICGILGAVPRGRRPFAAGGGQTSACISSSLHGAGITTLTVTRSRQIRATYTWLGCRS